MPQNYVDELGIMYSNIQIHKAKDGDMLLICSGCNATDRLTKYDDLVEELGRFSETHTKCSRTKDIIPPGESTNKIISENVYCSECGFPLLDLRQSYVKVYTNHIKLFCTKCSANTSYTKILEYMHCGSFWIIRCKKFFITDFDKLKFLYQHYMSVKRSRIIQPKIHPYPSSFDDVLIIANELQK